MLGLFEGQLQKMVALAVLAPIVASQGGNATTQTMTVAVRALATRDLSNSNAWRVIKRELMVGVFNGIADPATGRLALPPQCGETPGSAAETLRAELNQLDGFGTSKVAVTATFSEPVDLSSLADHVFLFRLATAGVPTDGSEGPVPLDVTLGHSFRGCPPTTVVDNVTLQPRTPLAGKSTYAVALLRGIKTATGAELQPSVTWALVRQSTEPVQFSSTGSVTYNATPSTPPIPPIS